ncbi:MAG: 50S ribosomal protein L18 [Thermoplasmata archaeon]|nr:50S ribosomal protein L18 [Thermoplasmata archaeon]
MATGPRYRVPFRRRREGKTDYRRRRALLKSRMPRAVVRKSSRHIRVQFVEFRPTGDRILSTTTSLHLRKMGWNRIGANVPGAYLTGYLAGKRALAAGIKEAVLDIGLAHPHPGGKLFSALKGMVDAGVEIPHSEDVLPDEERITGKHIGAEVEALFVKVKENIDRMTGGGAGVAAAKPAKPAGKKTSGTPGTPGKTSGEKTAKNATAKKEA